MTTDEFQKELQRLYEEENPRKVAGERSPPHVFVRTESLPKKWIAIEENERVAGALRTVTISGADDDVDPERLVHLSTRFPFVEWGILLSTSRAGSSRYPSSDWIRELSRGPVRLSGHLCGQLARDTLMGSSAALDELHPSFSRVQLNGYETLRHGFFMAAKRHSEIEYILQARTREHVDQAFDDELFAAAEGLAACTLIDPSGGSGESGRALWRERRSPDRYVGFAGGINPSNVIETIESCMRMSRRFWIDMESGVRSGDDKFDLALAEEVLEKSSRFASKEGESQ